MSEHRDAAGAPLPPACVAARRAMHERLDGSGDPAPDPHLEACSACRDRYEELGAAVRGLRALPALELPAADVEAILERTGPAALPARAGIPRAARRLVPLAAAAALVLAATVVLVEPPARAPAPEEARLREAMDDVRLVLGLTSDALGRSRDAAIKEVLEDELVPALRRLPLVGEPRRAKGRSS